MYFYDYYNDGDKINNTNSNDNNEICITTVLSYIKHFVGRLNLHMH